MSRDCEMAVGHPICATLASAGAGTLLEGEHSRFVIELLGPGRRKTPAAATLEALGAGAGDAAGQYGPPVAIGGTGDGSNALAANGMADGDPANGNTGASLLCCHPGVLTWSVC